MWSAVTVADHDCACWSAAYHGRTLHFLMHAPLSVWLVCVAVVLSSGCRLARDLLPRTHTTAVAPDGQTRAFVRQHLNPDPPDDHLYIARPGEPAREVMALAPDQDWCRAIVWSPDSRKVGFLINDRQLALYDARVSGSRRC